MARNKQSSRSERADDPVERTWWRVLLAVRQASLGGTRPFTVQDVAGAAELQGTERSSREDMASAWVGKLIRWGYIKQAGRVKGPERQIKTFEITKYGLERKEPGASPVWNREK